METKHTKGEWIIENGGGNIIIALNDAEPIICQLNYGGFSRPLEEQEANAKIIALSPKLLDFANAIASCDWKNVRNQDHNPFKYLAEQLIKKATE